MLTRIPYPLLIATLVLGLFAGPALGQPKPPTSADGKDASKVEPVKPVPKVTPEVSAEDAKQAAEHFDAGRKLFFQTDYAKAIKSLQAAIKLDPSRTSYRLLLAKAYRAQGEDANAAETLTAILKDNPEHVEAGLVLAELLDAEKQPDRVIDTLEPLVKFKTDYSLYHLLAVAYYQKASLLEKPKEIQEATRKAERYFEEAIRLNPRSADDHYQLGNIYLSDKRFARAAEVYETAGKLGASSSVYHFKLATVYYNLRNYLGRITTAEVIGGKTGQITRGDLYLIDPVPGQKDVFYVAGPKSAIFQAARAEQLGVKMIELQFLKANIWQSARRYDKADDIYKSIEKDINKADAGLFWFYWAQTALGQGDLETYLARLEKAIKLEPKIYEPTRADALVTVANRYHQRGDHKQYIEYLAKAVNTSPLSPRLHLALGDAYWQAGTKDKAIEQYRLVLELEPDNHRRVELVNRIRDHKAMES